MFLKKVEDCCPKSIGEIFCTVEEMRKTGKDVYNLAGGYSGIMPKHIALKIKEANDNKFPNPILARKALKKAILEVLEPTYSSIGNIVIGPGLSQLLQSVFCVILQPGDEVILPTPCWSYQNMIKNAGGIVKAVPTFDTKYKLTAEKLASAITPCSKVLVLNSPSNPTGAVYSQDELEPLVPIILKHGLLVVSDEVYGRLVFDDLNHVSISSLGKEIKECTITVSGFSKTFCLGRLQVAYSASSSTIAQSLNNYQLVAKQYISFFAIIGALAALNGPKCFVDSKINGVKIRKNYMVREVNYIDGLFCQEPSGGAFVWVNISRLLGKCYSGNVINSSSDFVRILLDDYRVAVVPGDLFEAPEGYLRLSLMVPLKDIQQGIAGLKLFISKIK